MEPSLPLDSTIIPPYGAVPDTRMTWNARQMCHVTTYRRTWGLKWQPSTYPLFMRKHGIKTTEHITIRGRNHNCPSQNEEALHANSNFLQVWLHWIWQESGQKGVSNPHPQTPSIQSRATMPSIQYQYSIKAEETELSEAEVGGKTYSPKKESIKSWENIIWIQYNIC